MDAEELLSIVGSVASIVSLGISFRSNWVKKVWISRIMFFLLFVTSILSGTFFYLYKQSVNEQLQIENRKLIVKQEAANLLKSAPAYISYYEPGESEGLLYSTLSLLEKIKICFQKLTKSINTM